MKITEHQRLEAELAELNELSANTPESDVIDRMSLAARKKIVLAALKSLSDDGVPARATLTFQGKPVVSGYGIFAEFAGQAVNRFTDAVAALAAGLRVPLGTRGTMPNRENYQLLITGTTSGSFGFELEEFLRQPAIPFEKTSPVGQALEQVRRLMEASLGSDDDLADAAVETYPRALAAVHDFLRTIVDNEAIFSLESKGGIFRFRDVDQVRHSAQRLSQDNIHEEEQWMDGQFHGVLPKRRTFEFGIAGTEEVLTGKVGLDIDDAGAINRILGQPVRIKVSAVQIRNGPVRYTLIDYEEPENKSILNG